jgi:molybdopterin/thiamine biosynthesis adenylyltransferase
MDPDLSERPAVPEAIDERYDRQVRIPGWDQEKLARARLGVAGDDPWLTSLFVTAAAALGLNRLTVAAPDLDPRLLAAARGLNPELDLAFFPGFLSHTLLADVLRGSDVLVDLGHYGLATKLLLTLAHREGLPLVRGWEFEEDGAAGVRLFTYLKGREWRELLTVLPRVQLPSRHRGDPVLGMVVAGLVLEETKKLLLGEPVTPEVVSYARPMLRRTEASGSGICAGQVHDQPGPPHPSPLPPGAGGEGVLKERRLVYSGQESHQTLETGWEPRPGFRKPDGPSSQPSCGLGGGCGGSAGTSGPSPSPHHLPPLNCPIAIVGAGALGNFAGLGLAALGFINLTFMDPDPVEVTNLNRQILFWDAVGEPKARALARRIGEWFGAVPVAQAAYVTRETDLSPYAAVLDCTDNFESRIVLSEKCREQGRVLVSGGTGVTAGQVVVFDPARGGPTPAELLGLYDLVGSRDVEVKERSRASCLYAPEPAVIMTNQIVGGLMVDALRRLLAGEQPPNLFYDARGAKML